MFTKTQKRFFKRKQDWFICSKGFRHELESEQPFRMKVFCPRCDWSITETVINGEFERAGIVTAGLEEKHLENCK